MNAGLFYLPDDWRDNQNHYGRRGHLRGGYISSLKVRVVSEYTLSQRTSLIALSRPAPGSDTSSRSRRAHRAR